MGSLPACPPIDAEQGRFCPHNYTLVTAWTMLKGKIRTLHDNFYKRKLPRKRKTKEA